MSLKNDDIENSLDNFQKLITDENKSDQEIENQTKEFLKTFSENLKPVIENVKQTKKELEKEIETHKEFVKTIEYCQQPEIQDLTEKEKELINLLKKDLIKLEKFYSIFYSFLEILSLIGSEDIISTSKRIGELQYEVNIISEKLKEKGIIER